MITLVGHGYIGKAIAAYLTETKTAFRWVNHTDPDIASTTRFTSCVINAAGFTGVPNVDMCEVYKDETIQGNIIFPLRLQTEAWLRSIPVIHITSGCVYNGYNGDGWTEEHEPNFTFNNGSFYSGSKSLFQEMMKPYLLNSYLLRIRMPFDGSHDSKNIFTKLSSYHRLINNVNSYSYVKDVAKVAVFFANTRPPGGIYNVCNPGYIDTKTVAKKLGIEKLWMTHDEFKAITKAPRSNCTLDGAKLQKIYPLRPVNEVMDEAIKEFLDTKT